MDDYSKRLIFLGGMALCIVFYSIVNDYIKSNTQIKNNQQLVISLSQCKGDVKCIDAITNSFKESFKNNVTR